MKNILGLKARIHPFLRGLDWIWIFKSLRNLGFDWNFKSVFMPEFKVIFLDWILELYPTMAFMVNGCMGMITGNKIELELDELVVFFDELASLV